jgi:hypothetical protein
MTNHHEVLKETALNTGWISRHWLKHFRPIIRETTVEVTPESSPNAFSTAISYVYLLNPGCSLNYQRQKPWLLSIHFFLNLRGHLAIWW